MTTAEKNALHAQIELRFANNQVGDITPAVTRDFLHELVDSVDSYSDAQAVTAVQAAFAAGTLSAPTRYLHELVFSEEAPGQGSLLAHRFSLRPGQGGSYVLLPTTNVAGVRLQSLNANVDVFNDVPAQWPAGGLLLVEAASYQLTVTPTNVNLPTFLLLILV